MLKVPTAIIVSFEFLMPVGHPLFLFSVGERTTYASDVHEHIGLSTVQKSPVKNGSKKLKEEDETLKDS